MPPQKKTFIIGAGSFGTALAIHLARQGHAVCLWGKEADQMEIIQRDRCNARYLPNISFPKTLTVCRTLEEGMACPDVGIVVPSHAFRNAVTAIKPFWQSSHRLFWGTKGLDPQSGGLLHEVVDDVLGPIEYAVLSGPSFAREVAQGSPTAVVIASNTPSFSDELTERFNGNSFRAYSNDDIIGVQLGGAVKNVMALAVGISDGLGFGANARSALMTRGLAEMVRLGLALGAKRETFMGLAGVGDLILTCTDDQSRNRRFGLALGRGEDLADAKKNIGQAIEGIRTTEQVFVLSQKHHVDMPIVMMVHHALNGQLSVDEAAKILLSRKVSVE